MRKTFLLLCVGSLLLTACKKYETKIKISEVQFTSHSKSDWMMTVYPEFSNTVSQYKLISSSDTLKETPNFVFGGAPDGQGFLKNPDGSGYIMVTNHENTWAVSRVYLNKKLTPIRGEYIVDTDGGMFRLCSGTLATPEEHGFPKPLFLTTGESNVNAMTHVIDPIAPATPKDQSRVLPALGKFSGENAVPLQKDAFPGKTVIICGEDAGNGQVYLYISNTPGDLQNGKLYALRRKDLNQIETAILRNGTYDVEFVEVPNAKNLTGAEIENLNTSLKSIQFARVEDLDYRKGGGANGREIYFVATGVSGSPEKTFWGRMYKLVLNAANPLEGKLSIAADGADNPGIDIINPDNVCVTQNFVYIQEDGDSFWPGAQHNSLIWQYEISSGSKKKMIDLRNNQVKGSIYNPTGDNRFGLWEWGAMIDISDEVGVPGTFLANIHAHSWIEGNRFLNPSKATAVQPYRSGGQTVILTGVPR